MNSNERMLIHSMAECFKLTSFNESNMNSDFDHKKPKINYDRPKKCDVIIQKNEESRPPILTLRDYLTASQNSKHNDLFPSQKEKESSESVKFK